MSEEFFAEQNCLQEDCSGKIKFKANVSGLLYHESFEYRNRGSDMIRHLRGPLRGSISFSGECSKCNKTFKADYVLSSYRVK